MGSGEQEHPSPAEPSGWAWILGTLALPGQSQRLTGPCARATFPLNRRKALPHTGGRLGSSPLGSTGPDKPRASVSPSVHQGWMWCWSPWAVWVEVRGQRAPWAVCSLVSPALPGCMSPLAPGEAAELASAVGDGATIHGRSGFCSVKPAVLGIDSPWVRLQIPFPWHPPPPLASQPRDAQVQLSKSHRTPGPIKAPLLHAPHASSRRGTFPPWQSSSAWLWGAWPGDPKTPPCPCPAALMQGPSRGSSPGPLRTGFVLLSLHLER